MAESSPAQETTPTAETHHDERNDEAAGEDEAAPLLPSSETSPPSQAPSPKAIYILTAAALSFSSSSLFFLIATAIALAAGPSNFQQSPQTRDAMTAIITPAIFSLLISTINLTRLRRSLSAAPLLINIILDVLLAFFAIAYGAAGLANIDGSYCYNRGPYDPETRDACMRHALPARIFVGVALGAACLFGLVHLVLFALRCWEAYRLRFWKGPWGFPNGQFTLEISVKVFREPQRPREVGEDVV